MLTSAEAVFENIYKNADVTFQYVTETEAVRRFLNYETPVTILARKLTDKELQDRTERGFVVQQLPLAKDAVTFVVSASNPDSLLSYRQTVDILNGQSTNWNQISSTNPSGNIAIVFQQNNSSTASFIRDSVLNGAVLPSNSYALKTHKEVFDYVRTNRGAVGVIALNWVSDTDDPEVHETMRGVRVLSIAPDGEPNAYYKPNPPSVRDNKYPFTRSVYLINGEGRTGLGTGFASYLASDPGVTLIERFGLVPYRTPVRVIETRKSYE